MRSHSRGDRSNKSQARVSFVESQPSDGGGIIHRDSKRPKPVAAKLEEEEPLIVNHHPWSHTDDRPIRPSPTGRFFGDPD